MERIRWSILGILGGALAIMAFNAQMPTPALAATAATGIGLTLFSTTRAAESI